MSKPNSDLLKRVGIEGHSPDIIIYPSSWYYNACVQAFLEVLAWGLGEDGNRIIEESLLQSDGRAIIPGHLAEAVFSTDNFPMPDGYSESSVPTELKAMKRLAWWWTAVGYEAGFMKKDDRGKALTDIEIVETVCRSLFWKGAPYPNLAQLNWDKTEFLNKWFARDHHSGPISVICSFCGQDYYPDTDARICEVSFTMSLSAVLGSGLRVFPNRFWNGNPNLTVCSACRSYFLFYHLIQRRRFFINTDSLQVNWHLNRLVAGKLKQTRFAYQTALLDALQYDPQLRKGISIWGLQNLEVLILERKQVHYYPLSPRLARMFLVPRVSSNLGRLSNPRVWETVLNEQFDYLPTMIYKSLRVYLTRENAAKDTEIVYDPTSIQPLVNLITLYIEIVRFLRKGEGGGSMRYINVEQLRGLGAAAPLAQDNNLIFRLLELTRLNRKADVYHLLLRIYVARNMEFPSILARLFSFTDPELFKTGIYAYISGLKPKSKDESSAD